MRTLWELIPEVGLSRITRAFSTSKISKFAISWFAKNYQIDLAEAELPVGDYQTLDQFFTRKLKQGIRPIADAQVIAPVDAIFRETGTVSSDQAMCEIKGKRYQLKDLLGRPLNTASMWTICHFYLSPRHYHRIHHPVGGQLISIKRIQGRLRPVHGTSARLFPELNFENARAVSEYQLKDGRTVFMVAITALNVSEIEITSKTGPAQKGDEWGMFHLGSAITLVMEGEWPLPPWSSGTDIKLGTRLSN